MIIKCDNCRTKFRLDDSQIKPNGVRVRCTKCQNVFVVAASPPVEEAQVEEIVGLSDESPMQAEESSVGVAVGDAASLPVSEDEAAAPSFDGLDFSLSVDRSGSGEAGVEGPEETDEADGVPGHEGFAEASTGESEGFPGAVEAGEAEEEPTGADDAICGQEAAGAEDSPVEEAGLSGAADATDEAAGAGGAPEWAADEELAGEQEYESLEEEVLESEEEFTEDFDLDFTAEKDEQRPDLDTAPETASGDEAADQAGEQAADMDKKVIPFTVGVKKAEESAERAPDFSEVFSHMISKDDIFAHVDGEGEEGAMEEVAPVPESAGAPKKPSSARLGLLVAGLIIILGGAGLYASGIIDSMARLITPGTAVVQPVSIEKLTGHVVENASAGPLFAIEAVVKNTTAEPQKIKTVRGMLYDKSGTRLLGRAVSPGRILSAADLRSLSKAEIDRHFKDSSGGTIPPKGIVPVMVVFTDLPSGVGEFGLDVVR